MLKCSCSADNLTENSLGYVTRRLKKPQKISLTKLTFFLLDTVTRNAYLLIQPGVDTAFITARRPECRGPDRILSVAFALNDSQTACSRDVADAVFCSHGIGLKYLVGERCLLLTFSPE